MKIKCFSSRCSGINADAKTPKNAKNFILKVFPSHRGRRGIFPENKPSLKIHADLGFRTVGYREKVGKMNGVWRDTILLERRSKKIN